MSSPKVFIASASTASLATVTGNKSWHNVADSSEWSSVKKLLLPPKLNKTIATVTRLLLVPRFGNVP